MPYKPIDEKIYRQYLKIVGWHLIKGGIDYKLFDENGAFLGAIKIAHGKKVSKKLSHIVLIKQSKNLKKEVGHGHRKRNQGTFKFSPL